MPDIIVQKFSECQAPLASVLTQALPYQHSPCRPPSIPCHHEMPVFQSRNYFSVEIKSVGTLNSVYCRQPWETGNTQQQQQQQQLLTLHKGVRPFLKLLNNFTRPQLSQTQIIEFHQTYFWNSIKYIQKVFVYNTLFMLFWLKSVAKFGTFVPIFLFFHVTKSK